MASVEQTPPAPILVVVRNIPKELHAHDLRSFFSQFVESSGFSCFHYKHRPEKVRDDKNSVDRGDAHCCVVKVENGRLLELCRWYNGKNWIRDGDLLAEKCVITKISKTNSNTHVPSVRLTAALDSHPENKQSNKSESSQTKRQFNSLPESSSNEQSKLDVGLCQLAELQPPPIMPQGNVGTSTKYFHKLINQCQLPSFIIKKLGLTFPKTKSNRRYGCVPFNYGTTVKIATKGSEEEEPAITADGQEVLAFEDSEKFELLRRKISKAKNVAAEKERKEEAQSDSEEDDDRCESWERHEAFHNDVTTQERTKERLFEEEIELVWEKGGPGVVFYTDAQFWAEKEGDFDEQTADEWDVDTSVYYEDGAGDKDARDSVTMRQETRRRQGLEETDRKTAGIEKRGKKSPIEIPDEGIGQFERFTKGFGRRVMENQGWKEGGGLGKSSAGISEALENDGQSAHEKSGFGYRGEKIDTFVRKRRAEKDVIISTIYDNVHETDPLEPLLRSRPLHHLKYCQPQEFRKSSNSTS